MHDENEKSSLIKNFAIFTGKYLCWSPFLIKNFKTTLLRKTPTEMFSFEHTQILKITYFEEHLRTAASIRWYSDTINLKQSDFCTTYSFKILVSDENIKIISKIVNLKKKKKKKKKIQFSYIYIRPRLVNSLDIDICAHDQNVPE